eukprot:4481487-Alexandrium_andersonii.AAC.1
MVLSRLGGAHSEPPVAFMDSESRQALRQSLLGPDADAWPSEDTGPQPNGRAVLLIDQSKAVERLAPAWLEAV